MPRRDVILDPPVSAWSAHSSGPSSAEVLVVAVGDGTTIGENAARSALERRGLSAAELFDRYEPVPDAGSVTAVPWAPGGPVRRVVLAGVGGGAPADWRAAGAGVGRATRGCGDVVHDVGGAVPDDALAGFVEGAVLGGWGQPRWTADGATSPTAAAARTTMVGDDRAARLVARAVARARAQLVARSLAMTPSNIKNPAWMVRQARTMAGRSGLGVRVWDDRDLRRDGFGGLLAVGSGSVIPPRLVQLEHRPPRSPTAPHVVLVGKGITFDTGGLQVKPTDGMLGMKTDMSGAAVVLATLAACRELEVPMRVTGLLALAENAVSGSAYRPGDVVRHYGGRTVEVRNTDAEGRLVLADALAYADANLAPDLLVDVATLTGAARVALGRSAAPLFSTDLLLTAALVDAGRTTGETLWPMPLPAAYRRALDSDVADLTHIAPSVGGGAVTAALFLREFVGARRWAHLDIAGAGRSDADAGIHAVGATGFGTRLLLRWLEEMQ